MTLVKLNNPCQVPQNRHQYRTWDSMLNNWMNVWDDSTSVNSRPGANILEYDEYFEINLSVPGYKKSDLSLVVENHVLTVSHKEETEKTDDQVRYIRREFTPGGFSRSFSLSRLVDTEKIAASCVDGILKIQIPKKAEAVAKPTREVKIQ